LRHKRRHLLLPRHKTHLLKLRFGIEAATPVAGAGQPCPSGVAARPPSDASPEAAGSADCSSVSSSSNTRSAEATPDCSRLAIDLCRTFLQLGVAGSWTASDCSHELRSAMMSLPSTGSAHRRERRNL
jgi:hypothetical protein